HGYPHVIRTGRAELIADVSDAVVDEMRASAPDREMIGKLELRSNLCVPLKAHGRILGAISFATTAASGRRYDDADLGFAADLAPRASLAIDNALLYRRSQELYREAQHLNRVKDEFLATLSHELRTPLSVILSWAYLLRSGRLDAQKSAVALE